MLGAVSVVVLALWQESVFYEEFYLYVHVKYTYIQIDTKASQLRNITHIPTYN